MSKKRLLIFNIPSYKRMFLCKKEEEALDFFIDTADFFIDTEEEEKINVDDLRSKYNFQDYISEDDISIDIPQDATTVDIPEEKKDDDDRLYRECHFIQLYEILEYFVCLFYKNNILEDFTMKSRGIEPNTCLKSERILYTADNKPFTNFRLQPNNFWLDLSNSICFKTEQSHLHALILSSIDELKEKDPRLEDIIAFEKKTFEQARIPLYFCQYDLSRDIDDKLLTKYIISDTRTLYARMFFNNGFKLEDINLSLSFSNDTIRPYQREGNEKKR